jgi:hypothetical protein
MEDSVAAADSSRAGARASVDHWNQMILGSGAERWRSGKQA